MRKIKAKKTRVVNGKTIIVGVDIGMITHTGYYRCPDGTDMKSFEFSVNKSIEKFKFEFHSTFQNISCQGDFFRCS